jgi:ankyrin repeat protein
LERQAKTPIIRELLAAGANPRFVSADKIANILDPEVRALLAEHRTADAPQTDATNRIPFPLAQNPWFQLHGPVPENRFVDPRSKQTSPPLRDRLHRAAATGDQEGIRAALAEGAWIDATDAKGWTALIHALNGKQKDAARLLSDLGASLNRVTDFGSSPLCFAANIGSPDFVDELIDLGADPNLYESKSGSPLTIALEKDLAVARRLLSREADPRLLIEVPGDIHHVPALFIFAGRGNLPAVQTLVAAGVDPKTVLRRGKWAQKPSHLVNALPFAASSNDLPTLNYFLSLGLDPAQEDAYGDNALDWALARKADRTAAHLRTLGVKTRSERGLPAHDD